MEPGLGRRVTHRGLTARRREAGNVEGILRGRREVLARV
jgi:hypothetical protein